MRKIYIVGRGFNGYANWMQGEITKNIKEADLVVFCGGEDVDPRVYNEPMGKHTYSSIDRDRAELEEFKIALELKIPVVGICRGLK